MTASSQQFPSAPDDWSKNTAIEKAKEEGLELSPTHWEVIQGLQDYFARHEFHKSRELHDALEEKFHHLGGMKALYKLFPNGPVAQGCRMAGIQPPAGSIDLSFGSVS